MSDDNAADPTQEYYYCYCLVGGGSSPSLEGLTGVPGGLPPETRSLGAITAIVSRVASEDYSEDVLRANLERMEWVTAAVTGHEQVVEGCMRQTEVIPLRLCTLFRSESALDSAFLARQEELSAKLQYLREKQEWGLRLTADRSRLRQQLTDTDPRFRVLRGDFEGKSAGASYFLRKRGEEQLERAADQSRCDVADLAFSRLRVHACEAALAGDSRAGDNQREAVMNAAFLLTGEQLAHLLDEARRIQLEYPWLDWEKSGPWPPYNFV